MQRFFCNSWHCRLRGMVLATTRLSMGDASILSMAGPERTGWVQQACIPVAPLSLSGLGCLGQCACRINHVIKDNGCFAFYFSDDIHCLGDIGCFASFIYDGQACVQAFGKGPGPFHTAGIRRNDNQVIVCRWSGYISVKSVLQRYCPRGY